MSDTVHRELLEANYSISNVGVLVGRSAPTGVSQLCRWISNSECRIKDEDTIVGICLFQ